jgi:hypothetical protein
MTSKGRNQLVPQGGAGSARSAAERKATGGKTPSNRQEAGPHPVMQSEVAGYIEGLAAEMRAMAHSVDLDSLAYFLEMARLEASIQVQRLARSGAD